jgi:Cu/Ag efflux pump CusA
VNALRKNERAVWELRDWQVERRLRKSCARQMIAIFFKMVIILISFLTVLTMRPLAPPK